MIKFAYHPGPTYVWLHRFMAKKSSLFDKSSELKNLEISPHLKIKMRRKMCKF